MFYFFFNGFVTGRPCIGTSSRHRSFNEHGGGKRAAARLVESMCVCWAGVIVHFSFVDMVIVDFSFADMVIVHFCFADMEFVDFSFVDMVRICSSKNCCAIAFFSKSCLV